MPTQAQLEAEELLDEMENVKPLTQEEVCFWYGIKAEDYPRWIQAGIERELESLGKLARDAMVHLAPQRDGRVIIKWLASISRGSGRAALTTIVEAADRHKIGLELTARPQRPTGSGKQMTPEELETFFAGFGFLFTGRDEGGFAFMMRVPTP